jgi:hypothetical protein
VKWPPAESRVTCGSGVSTDDAALDELAPNSVPVTDLSEAATITPAAGNASGVASPVDVPPSCDNLQQVVSHGGPQDYVGSCPETSIPQPVSAAVDSHDSPYVVAFSIVWGTLALNAAES